jgi:hypothetical protein
MPDGTSACTAAMIGPLLAKALGLPGLVGL